MSNIERENIVDEIPRVEFRDVKSAFGRRIREFEIVNIGFKSIEEFLVSAFEIYQVEISKAIAEFKLIKTVSYLSAEFERSFHVDADYNVLSEYRDIHLPTKNCEIDTTTDLRKHFEKNIIDYVVNQVDEVMV